MTDDKKKELFPYFAYIYSQELNPEKYGQASSLEEWSSLIQDSKEDIDSITNAADQLTDDEWDVLDQQYTEQVGTAQETQKQYIKKGAKLKELKMGTKEIAVKKDAKPEMMKKGGKKKKCACGCEVITKKFKGGQLVDACGCCGKDHSKFLPETPETLKTGGKLKLEKKIVKKQAGGDSTSASSQVGVAKCGGKVKDRIKKAQQGAKLNLNFTGLPSVNNSVINGAADPANAKLNFNWGTMKQTNLTFPTTKTNQIPTLTRTITNYLPKTKLQNDTVYGGNDVNGEYYSFNKTDNPQEYAQMRGNFNKFLNSAQTQVTNRKKGGTLNKAKAEDPTPMQKSISEKKNRIGKAKINSAKCGKKLKPKMK